MKEYYVKGTRKPEITQVLFAQLLAEDPSEVEEHVAFWASKGNWKVNIGDSDLNSYEKAREKKLTGGRGYRVVDTGAKKYNTLRFLSSLQLTTAALKTAHETLTQAVAHLRAAKSAEEREEWQGLVEKAREAFKALRAESKERRIIRHTRIYKTRRPDPAQWKNKS